MHTKLIPLCLLTVLAAALQGCLYTNIHTPRAYRSATPSDVKATLNDETVSGKACLRSVLYMAAWGNGGYAAAVKDALKGHPNAILYDVRSDMKVSSYVLGLYTQACTVVTGKVGTP